MLSILIAATIRIIIRLLKKMHHDIIKTLGAQIRSENRFASKEN
jgi:hypothetical protein